MIMSKLDDLDEETLKELENRMLERLKNDGLVSKVSRDNEIKKQKELSSKYIQSMENTTNPWVGIIGTLNPDNFLETEVSWNDSFVELLKSRGAIGSSDDHIIVSALIDILNNMVDVVSNTPEEDE